MIIVSQSNVAWKSSFLERSSFEWFLVIIRPWCLVVRSSAAEILGGKCDKFTAIAIRIDSVMLFQENDDQ